MITTAFASLAILFASPLWATHGFVQLDPTLSDARRIELVAPANTVAESEARQFLANMGRIRQYCVENKLEFASSIENGIKFGQNTIESAKVDISLKKKLGDNLTVTTCNFQVTERGNVLKTATFIFIYRQDETRKWRLIEIEPM